MHSIKISEAVINLAQAVEQVYFVKGLVLQSVGGLQILSHLNNYF
jgi:hypothetical protein